MWKEAHTFLTEATLLLVSECSLYHTWTAWLHLSLSLLLCLMLTTSCDSWILLKPSWEQIIFHKDREGLFILLCGLRGRSLGRRVVITIFDYLYSALPSLLCSGVSGLTIHISKLYCSFGVKKTPLFWDGNFRFLFSSIHLPYWCV